MAGRQFRNCETHRDVAILHFDSIGEGFPISITLPWESAKQLQAALFEALQENGRPDLMGETVLFDGQGPFDLPVMQSSTATAEGNTVVPSIRILVTPSRMGTVRIPMLANQAIELAAQLNHCADQALEWERENNR